MNTYPNPLDALMQACARWSIKKRHRESTEELDIDVDTAMRNYLCHFNEAVSGISLVRVDRVGPRGALYVLRMHFESGIVLEVPVYA